MMTPTDSIPPAAIALGSALFGALAGVILLDARGDVAVLVVALMAAAIGTVVALLVVRQEPVAPPTSPEGSVTPWQSRPDRTGQMPGGAPHPAERSPVAPASSADPGSAQPPPQQPPPLSPPQPPPPQPPLPLSPPPPARHVVHDLGSADGGSNRPSDWWSRPTTSAPGTPQDRSATATTTRIVTDLGPYVDDAQVAQCPNCGEFRVGVEATGDVYVFHCPSCLHEWTWQPGAPWPGINVTPRRRSSGPARA